MRRLGIVAVGLALVVGLLATVVHSVMPGGRPARPAFPVGNVRRFFFLALLVFVTILRPPGGLPAAGAGTLVVWNGTLFDGTGSDPVANGAVVIDNGIVVDVGPFEAVSVPAGAVWVNADGGTILPGVIDAHVHTIAELQYGIDVLSPWLESGVTTLQDLGTVKDGIQLTRDAIESIAARPPRIQLAGPIITAVGGYPIPTTYSAIAWEVATPEEARLAVADLIDNQGADLIKIAIEAGFHTDYDEPGWPVLTPDQVAAITEEAHKRGILVAAHVTGPGELAVAISGGVDVAAHTPTTPVPDPVLLDAIAHGIILVSTTYAWGGGGTDSLEAAANAARYWELGGMVALGTDYPYAPPSMPLVEFDLLSQAGIPARDLIVAATKNSAAAIGRESDLGTLEVGKVGDVIVVGGNPLADLRAMGAVNVVILAGQVVKGTPVGPPVGPPVGGFAELPALAGPPGGSGVSGTTYAVLAGAAAGVLAFAVLATLSVKRRGVK
jgi:imidazolonepropionase-like amidohydrolase